MLDTFVTGSLKESPTALDKWLRSTKLNTLSYRIAASLSCMPADQK